MPTYTPPLRDMRFLMHEVLKVTDEFKAIPRYAEADAERAMQSSRSDRSAHGVRWLSPKRRGSKAR